MSRKMSTKVLTYAAICIALATALSYVKLFKMPQGGSVSACSMFFITVVGYWFGPVTGIVAGVAHGLLQLIIEPYVVHPIQFLLDYPVAFGVLGISGFFRFKKHGLYVGYTVGCMARWFCSFLSGLVFFAEYTPEGMNPILYSASYNLSYILPEMLITLVIISVPAFYQAIVRMQEPARTPAKTIA